MLRKLDSAATKTALQKASITLTFGLPTTLYKMTIRLDHGLKGRNFPLLQITEKYR